MGGWALWVEELNEWLGLGGWVWVGGWVGRWTGFFTDLPDGVVLVGAGGEGPRAVERVLAVVAVGVAGTVGKGVRLFCLFWSVGGWGVGLCIWVDAWVGWVDGKGSQAHRHERRTHQQTHTHTHLSSHVVRHPSIHLHIEASPPNQSQYQPPPPQVTYMQGQGHGQARGRRPAIKGREGMEHRDAHGGGKVVGGLWVVWVGGWMSKTMLEENAGDGKCKRGEAVAPERATDNAPNPSPAHQAQGGTVVIATRVVDGPESPHGVAVRIHKK